MSDKFLDRANTSIDGHVLIKDADTNEVLLDKHNAINFENFALAIMNAVAYGGTGDGLTIGAMAFGNAGTVIDDTGNITYKYPNVDTPDGELYVETYRKDVVSGEDGDISTLSYSGESYNDIIVTVTLEYDEPDTQDAIDNGANMNGDFVFDELGLVGSTGKFLTHLIFHPIQKSANRRIQIIYTIRIRAGQ